MRALAQTYSALRKIITPDEFHALTPQRQELLLEIALTLRNQAFNADGAFDKNRMIHLANDLGIPPYALPITAPNGVNLDYLNSHIFFADKTTYQEVDNLKHHLVSLKQWRAIDEKELYTNQSKRKRNPNPSTPNTGKKAPIGIAEDNHTLREEG